MTRFELADAMLKGLHTPGVTENKMNYVAVSTITGSCKACALGCALIGFFDGDYIRAKEAYYKESLEDRGQRYGQWFAAYLLDISIDLALEIEHKHINDMSVQQIAVWLKTSDWPKTLEQEVKA